MPSGGGLLSNRVRSLDTAGLPVAGALVERVQRLTARQRAVNHHRSLVRRTPSTRSTRIRPRTGRRRSRPHNRGRSRCRARRIVAAKDKCNRLSHRRRRSCRPPQRRRCRRLPHADARPIPRAPQPRQRPRAHLRRVEQQREVDGRDHPCFPPGRAIWMMSLAATAPHRAWVSGGGGFTPYHGPRAPITEPPQSEQVPTRFTSAP